MYLPEFLPADEVGDLVSYMHTDSYGHTDL